MCGEEGERANACRQESFWLEPGSSATLQQCCSAAHAIWHCPSVVAPSSGSGSGSQGSPVVEQSYFWLSGCASRCAGVLPHQPFLEEGRRGMRGRQAERGKEGEGEEEEEEEIGREEETKRVGGREQARARVGERRI